MVSKNDINLIFEEVLDNKIRKCSTNKIPSNSNSFGVRFNKKVRKALDDFADETCGENPRGTEKLHLINENGEVVYTRNGNKTSVSCPNYKKMYKLVSENGQLHNEHNHPIAKGDIEDSTKYIPTMLSVEDARTLLETGYVENGRFESVLGDKWDYYYKSITAESPNGSRITLIKNNDFNSANENDYMNTYHKLDTAWQKYCREFKSSKTRYVSYLDTDYKGWFREMYHLEGKSHDECIDAIDRQVVKDLGKFEDNIQDIREDFNKCNVELSIEWRQ